MQDYIVSLSTIYIVLQFFEFPALSSVFPKWVSSFPKYLLDWTRNILQGSYMAKYTDHTVISQDPGIQESHELFKAQFSNTYRQDKTS